MASKMSQLILEQLLYITANSRDGLKYIIWAFERV